MTRINKLKTLKVLTALGLAIITCAFVFLPNPAVIQSSPEILSLPREYAISAAIGRDQSAFHPVPKFNGFHASNTPQSLTVDFSTDKVIIRSGPIYWNWQLDAYGYGDDLIPVTSAEPIATANRVEYRHGAITEWYINGPLGLQQGFDLIAPPPVERTETPLTLIINLAGNGQAEGRT